MAAALTTQTTDSTRRLPLTRGRRTALAVGVPACLALVAATGLSLLAAFGGGSFQVRYTVPAKTQTLTLVIPGGNVAVTGAATGLATLSGTARYSIARSALTEHVDLPQVSVGYHCPVPVGRCVLNTSLTVPPGVNLSLSTGGGNVVADDFPGAIDAYTSKGNVTAQRVSGPLLLESGSGNIRADGIGADAVDVFTGGGDVEVVLTRVPDDLDVYTGGGNITLVVPRGLARYHVVASTSAGRVRVTVPRTVSTHGPVITARSGGGNITIREV